MGHLSWNCAPTSCRHVIRHTLLILLPCSSTVPRRPAPGCKELRQPHTNCAAVDNSSCLQVEEQFVRPRPLHVAQPHRHPHGSRTRPGHCGPPLTTAGVRQRGCSPSDGVSAMTRGVLHGITNKCPHRTASEHVVAFRPLLPVLGSLAAAMAGTGPGPHPLSTQNHRAQHPHA